MRESSSFATHSIRPSNVRPSRNRIRRRQRNSLWRMTAALYCGAACLGMSWSLRDQVHVHAMKSNERPSMQEQQHRTSDQQSQSPSHEPTYHQQRQRQQQSSSLFVLCTADGRLYSVNAWTGASTSPVATTDPLIARSIAGQKTDITTNQEYDSESASFTNEDNENDETFLAPTSGILPGLDGRLYWQDDETHQLQALPLTIQSLLEHPVRSCDEEEDSEGPVECGILTATVETSLLSFDETGSVLWDKDHPLADQHETDDAKGSTTTLLLQRKDYRVQQVSSRTGEQVWNVTLGTWQALDFGDEDEEQDAKGDGRSNAAENMNAEDPELLLPSRIQDKRETLYDTGTRENPSGSRFYEPLPAIAFGGTGRTLLAVHPESRTVLWRLDTDSVVASVFGIHEGRWKKLQVLSEDEIYYAYGLPKNTLQLPARESSNPQQMRQDDILHELLWSQPQWYQNKQDHDSQYPYRPPELPASSDSPVVGVGSYEVCVAGDCPNHKHVPLGLPSPPIHATTSWEQSGGVLLSWRVVGVLFLTLVLIAILGRRWYLRKKNSWITRALQMQLEQRPRSPGRPKSFSASPSSTPDGLVTTRSIDGDGTSTIDFLRSPIGSNPRGGALKRSLSLPVAFDPKSAAASRAEAEKPSDELPHSEDIRGLQSDKMDQPSIPEPATAVATPSLGSIPLVRYSRYASEFNEVEALGKGGFGTVFKCQNVLDGREYAVKKVSIRGSADDPSFQQRLERVLREVKILAVLDHPNIVRYYTAWLELEQGVPGGGGGTSKTSDFDEEDESMSMSRCYSSSLLTESVSQWQPTKPVSPPPSHSKKNPLGWGNSSGLLSADNNPPRRSIRRTSSIEQDYGFIFEGSEEDDDDCSDIFDRTTSEVDMSRRPSASGRPSKSGEFTTRDESIVSATNNKTLNNSRRRAEGSSMASSSKTVRHILYIQMQLCTQSTIADFLSNPSERKGVEKGAGVDIPLALRLFHQIAKAVQHVHEQGLIHRDLKPQNCFIDETGTVKVGDFGLSRESGGEGGNRQESMLEIPLDDVSTEPSTLAGHYEDQTAGVGTRAYASPEQMNGSNYDSSTDVYSLGIMLFELVYQMATIMERNICISQLRQDKFPNDWEACVGRTFPTLRTLIRSMLSESPSERPSATNVCQDIHLILSEYTMVSLDESRHHGQPHIVLLRVEASDRAEALGQTIKAINESAEETNHSVDIVEYGLRSATDDQGRPAAIMEFALRYPGSGADLVAGLSTRPEIRKVRQVSTATSRKGSNGVGNGGSVDAAAL